MTKILVKKTIDASAKDVWNTIRSFEGVERYLPIITSSTVKGSGAGAQRTCSVQFGDQQGKILEIIDNLDDENKILQFSIVEAPFPFQGVQLNMQVKTLDKTKSEFQVWSELNDEQVQPIQEVFQMIADGLKKLHEKRR